MRCIYGLIIDGDEEETPKERVIECSVAWRGIISTACTLIKSNKADVFCGLYGAALCAKVR